MSRTEGARFARIRSNRLSTFSNGVWRSLICSEKLFAEILIRAASMAADDESTARIGPMPRLAVARARIPDPVPASKTLELTGSG